MSRWQLRLLLILLASLSGRLGNPVQVSLAGLGDPAATLLLVLLEDANLLESLHDLAVDAAAGVDVLRRARSPVLGRAVHLPQPADTDRLAQVDVAGDGGGTDVEPVSVLRWQLLSVAGLDRVDPAFTRD